MAEARGLRCWCGAVLQRSVAQWRRVNWNVRLALLQAVGTGVADSVWMYTLFASFVFTLADGSNTAVGILEMLQGVTTLLVALPMGVLADRWSKAGVIRLGGVFALGAMAATSVVVVLASRQEKADADSPAVQRCLVALGVCVCLWGVVDAVVQGPVPALFADSVPPGSRSRWYTYLFNANMAARTVGPALTIAMFSICGDSWSLPQIRNVFLVGMLAELLNAPSFFFFDDKQALGGPKDQSNDLSEALLSEAPENSRSGAGGEDVLDHGHVLDGLHDAGGVELEPRSPRAGRALGSVVLEPEGPKRAPPIIPGRGCFGQYLGIRAPHIPYILFAMDVVVAFGSGMTIKFFPLFWKEEVGLSPSQVQAIFLAVPIAIGVCSGLGMWMARRIGRVFAFLVVKAVGLSFLVLMVVMRKRVHALVLILFYLVRTGLMNCTYPLEESILMDSVAPSSRARWKSLQSITAFGWTGSAALGGFLGDRHGYAFTFLITAALQGAGSLLILLIAHLIPLEVEEDEEEEGFGTSKGGPGGKYQRVRQGDRDEHSNGESEEGLSEMRLRFPQFFPSRPAGDDDDGDVYMSLDGDRAVAGAGDLDVEFVSMEDGMATRGRWEDRSLSFRYSFDAPTDDTGGGDSDEGDTPKSSLVM